MSAIQADFRTFKHIPSRKCYQLIMEIPEENFSEVCQTLGYPKTGENTFVGIALLDKAVIKEQLIGGPTEGERLRTRAIMLCKEETFQAYIGTILPSKFGAPSESEAAWCIKSNCNIKSRSELATNQEAQVKFKELLEKYKDWQFENSHGDNIR
jgi:hypothetical protein